jgi:hypothetical protein
MAAAVAAAAVATIIMVVLRSPSLKGVAAVD